MLGPGPATIVRTRRGVAVLGLAAAALAVTISAANVGFAVPIGVALGGLLLGITLGSTWHGLFIVVTAAALVPITFAVRVGPVTASVGRVLLWTLCIGFVAARTRPDRPIRFRRTPIDGPLLLVLGTMLLATVAAMPFGEMADLLGALRKTAVFGIDFALLFWVTVCVLHDDRRRDRLLAMIAGLVCVVAALGLLEHVTGTNVFRHLAPILPGGIVELLDAVAASSEAALSRGQITRVRSTVEGPLPFAIVLLLGLPLATAFALLARDRLARVLWVAGTGAIGASLLLTAARSGYILAFITLVTLLVLLRERRARVAVVGVGLAVGLLFASQPGVRDTMLVFFRPQRGVVFEGSVQARVDDYRPVLGLVDDRPWLGYGPRSFAVDSLRRTGLLEGEEGGLVLDNAYLQHLAETGLLGLLALVGLLAAAWAAALRSVRRATTVRERTLCVGMFAAVQSWILMGFAADVYVFNAPPRLFFVLLGAVAVTRVWSGWEVGGEPAPGAPAQRGATATAPEPAG